MGRIIRRRPGISRTTTTTRPIDDGNDDYDDYDDNDMNLMTTTMMMMMTTMVIIFKLWNILFVKISNHGVVSKIKRFYNTTAL